MCTDINTQQVLKATTELLQDIEGELYFRTPHSAKLAEIRHMILWLQGGEPIASYTSTTKAQEVEWPSEVDGLWDKSTTSPFDEVQFKDDLFKDNKK